MNVRPIWVEGDFRVLILPSGAYEAHVRVLGGDNTLRIGTGSTPAEAIAEALA